MPGFAVDLLRTTIWFVLLALIFIPLERLFAERPQAILRREFAADIGYYFLNGLITTLVLGSMTGLLAVAVHRVMPASVQAIGASLALWQRVLATLVVGEFGFYWGHRWSHEIPLLWRFHSIHHSPVQVDWLTNTRGHPVDVVFTRLCGFLLIHLAGLAQPDAGGSVTLSLMTIFTILWGFFIHANLRWRLGWLESVIATPAFHRWHHVSDEHRDRNYASTLPIYDRLFGTLHLPKQGIPPGFGIDSPMPASMPRQLLHPFV